MPDTNVSGWEWLIRSEQEDLDVHLRDEGDTEMQQAMFGVTETLRNAIHIEEEGDGVFAVYRGTIRVTHPTTRRATVEQDESYQNAFSYTIFPYSDGTYHPKWRYGSGTWYHFCAADNEYKVCGSLALARRYMQAQCITVYTVMYESISVA